MAATVTKIKSPTGLEISLPTGIFIDNEFKPAADGQELEVSGVCAGAERST